MATPWNSITIYLFFKINPKKHFIQAIASELASNQAWLNEDADLEPAFSESVDTVDFPPQHNFHMRT